MITDTLARPAAHPRPGWGLWAAWILATMGGVMASLLIFAAIPSTDGTFSLLPCVVIIAMIISMAQWPVLSRYLPALSPRQWLGANVLGGIAAFFVGWASIYTVILTLYIVAKPSWDTRTTWELIMAVGGGAGVGIVVALAQWLALRPYLRKPIRWIYAGAAAWAWAGAVEIIMQNSLWPPAVFAPVIFLKNDPSFVATLSRATGLPEGIVFFVLLSVAGGLLIGGITGLALVALVRARAEETR